MDILAKSVGYIAGYNLRLLPIIQSLSQLESIYGEKDARTFITNHTCQVLFAPREHKDAHEYSQMLGTYTADAISTGQSAPRAWGRGGQGATNSQVSQQSRALMLPQELKELGEGKAIINLMNTKPILCDKARFYADPALVDRLKAISPSLKRLGRRLPTQPQLEEAAFVRKELAVSIPVLDLDLHKAKAEQRIRPLTADEPIDLSRVTIDRTALPPLADHDPPSQEDVTQLVDAFFKQLEWTDPAVSAPRTMKTDESQRGESNAELAGQNRQPTPRATAAVAFDLSVLDDQARAPQAERSKS